MFEELMLIEFFSDGVQTKLFDFLFKLICLNLFEIKIFSSNIIIYTTLVKFLNNQHDSEIKIQ